MNDPGRLDLSEISSILGSIGAFLVGLVTIILFSKQSKKNIYAEMDKREEAMKERIESLAGDLHAMDERHLDHHAQLIKLEANQVNTAEKLLELKQIHKEGLEKLENKVETSRVEINTRLGDLMRELRTKT